MRDLIAFVLDLVAAYNVVKAVAGQELAGDVRSKLHPHPSLAGTGAGQQLGVRPQQVAHHTWNNAHTTRIKLHLEQEHITRIKSHLEQSTHYENQVTLV
jgi:hypothetical protein